MDIRRYYKTRQLIDVDEFLSGTGDYFVMCLSKAQIYALRKMAKTRLLWRTTYSAEAYQDSYLLPNDTQWDLIDAHISEFVAQSERVEMCNNQLVNALNNIAEMVRLSSCCWEGGTGGQEIGDDFYYGTEEPLSEPVSFGAGEEFSTQEAWETHKCEVANGIVNGLIGSLNGMSLLTLSTLIASSVLAAIVGIGLIAVPPVAIIMAILATGLTFAFFSNLADELDDNRAYLVCLLYNASTAIDAYDNLKSAIEDLSVDLGLIEIQVGPVIDLIMQMAPIDTMNSLYTNVGLPSVPGTVIACETECAECPGVYVYYGTYDPETNQVVAEDTGGGEYYVGLYFNAVDHTEYCGEEVTVGISEISGTPNHAGPYYGYRFYDQEDNLVYYDVSSPPSSPVSGVGRITLRSSVASFTVELSIT